MIANTPGNAKSNALHASTARPSSVCFFLFYLLLSSLSGQNLITALLVVTQGILSQNAFPTLARLVITTSIKMFETVIFNRMVLYQIVKHLANLVELARFQRIINMWNEMTILRALTVKPFVKYLDGPKKLKRLGQRRGVFCSRDKPRSRSEPRTVRPVSGCL